jgi:putative NADH-flavin reductase
VNIHDLTLSAFGPTTLGTTDLRKLFGQKLAAAAELSNVRRILIVSSALLFDNIGWFGNILKATIFKKMLPDMANMEKAVMKNTLDWTIVRPPRLSDSGLTAQYKVEQDRLPNHSRIVSRADVADFMIKEAERNEYHHSIVGVC